MKLGIMQPYFFPYLGYFDLILQTDKWIIFDVVQYIRHGWMNRNRILHPAEGWQYIIAPLKKHGRSDPISEISANDDQDWRGRILGQLGHYKKKAPFYNETLSLVNDCFDASETSLSKLNGSILSRVCNYLGIPFEAQYFSEMDMDLGPVEGPGDWALRISEALGATEYLNPPGGIDLFDPEDFNRAGVKLRIQNYKPIEYACRGYEFIPNLSIIDVLMWVPKEKIIEHLKAQQS